MKDIEIKKIDKNIYVYKKLIPNAKEIVQLLKNSEANKGTSFLFDDWQPWSRFGSYVYSIGGLLSEDNPNSKNKLYLEELDALNTILDCFYYATNDFMSSHSLSIGSDWVRMGPSFSKYTHDNEPHLDKNSLEMAYHTDYKFFEADSPGNKFALTCTMYLNDDYEDGGISFLNGDKQTIDYKPEAGDVLVFPSGHPDLLSEDGNYLHGVRRIRNVDKYLVRCFYQIPFEGTEEWHKNRLRFGAEEWEKMEQHRIKNNQRYHDFQKDNIYRVSEESQ